MLALERFAPNAFYRLLALIAYGLSIIFWLSGWTWCASWAAGYLSLTSPTLNSDNYYARVGGALAACAGLGAITW